MLDWISQGVVSWVLGGAIAEPKPRWLYILPLDESNTISIHCSWQPTSL